MFTLLDPQTDLAIFLVGSFVLLTFALWSGNAGLDWGRRSGADRVGPSAEGVYRLRWTMRLKQGYWRLPGVKLKLEGHSLAELGAACSVEYASRLGTAVRAISSGAI